MQYFLVKKFQGIIAHFDTAGFMVAIGKHGLEIEPQFSGAAYLGMLPAKVCKIVYVPPVALFGPVT